MLWLERIRSKPREEKISLIWKITALAIIILIGVWVLLHNLTPNRKKDLKLFKDAGNIIKESKEQFPNLTKPTK